MRALISDVHSNLEALSAVLEDIEAHGVEEIYFLGDLVGYGPDPEPCIDIVAERCAVTLKGNHDFALINGPQGFNFIAAEAIDCTRTTMMPPCYSMNRKRKDRWHFVDGLSLSHTENGVFHVHGSPLNPLTDYVFCKRAAYMWNELKLTKIFSKFERLMFCGHTHHPCLIYDDFRCYHPDEVDYTLVLEPRRKAIINVGSVGQPRDHDNRSCYLLYDEDAGRVTWRRVPYDFETTAGKIERIDCIDNRCGERLRVGI